MLRRTLLTAGLALTASSVLAKASTTATAFDTPLTLPDMPLHDPWVVADKASKTYYLFTSNNPRLTGESVTGIMVYTSANLINWTKPRIVFRLPEGIWANAGGWAPEVHEWRGKYYLFTTVHNESAPLPKGTNDRPLYRRGTVLAVADTLDGPFELVRGGEPVAPKEIMSLDGSLFVDEAGKPWMVYAHEWIQMGIGTMEAIPLDDNLAAIGPPLMLFKGSDSKWAVPQQGTNIVTDGPEIHRTKNGALVMLWSSWGQDGYIQTLARSPSGQLTGPWEQLPMLLGKGSGHGMLFTTFDGQLMLIVHRPFKNARGKLYEVRDTGDSIELTRQRVDLDRDPTPLAPYKE